MSNDEGYNYQPYTPGAYNDAPTGPAGSEAPPVYPPPPPPAYPPPPPPGYSQPLAPAGAPPTYPPPGYSQPLYPAGAYPPPPAYSQPLYPTGYPTGAPPSAYPAGYPPPQFAAAPMATGYMYPAAYPVAQRTNGFAITSFVLSLVGLCGIFTYGIGGIGSILAVIFGHIAISQINRSSGTLGGKGLAIAGLVMGYIGLAGVVIVIAVIIFGTLASSSFQ